MTENELIVWSSEYTTRGIRESSDIEDEIIACYFGYSDKEVLDKVGDIFDKCISEKNSELDFDDIIENIYIHNSDRIRELAFIQLLDDIKQSGKEIEEFNTSELEEMIYNNEVGIEECMYYNSCETENDLIYRYASDNGISYIVYPNGGYGCTEFESLTYEHLKDCDSELPIVVNNAQQVMFEELIYEGRENFTIAKYGNFFLSHDKSIKSEAAMLEVGDKYERIERC